MQFLSRKTILSIFVFALLVSISGVFFSRVVHADASWFNASWQYRVKVTVDHSKVGADLTNFPVYVDLSGMPASFFTNVQSDGGDIRVTESDGTTEVPREVVAIDTGSDTGELHFKAPTLSSATDEVFYVYYGNASATGPAASATYGLQNVWSNGYVAVYHLNENPAFTNLLVNPGGETGNINGWTVGVGSFGVQTPIGGIHPYQGLYQFRGDAGAEDVMYQDVALLSNGYTASNIDAGNVGFTYQGFQANNFESPGVDKGQLIMEFLDSSGTEIGSASTTLQAFPVQDIWHLVSVSATLPSGTRTIRAKVRSVLFGGTNINVFFDNLSLSDADSGFLIDSTANKNKALAVGNMMVADSVAGEIGKSISFDGSDDTLVVPHDASLDFGTGNVTVSLWMNPTSLPVKQGIFDNGDGSSAGLRFITSDSSGSELQLIRGSQFSDGVNSNAVLTTGWQHVTMSTVGDVVTFYRNAVNAGSGTLANTTFTNANSFHIGQRGYTGSSVVNFGGDMDEMRVSNLTRSADWISTAYNNQSSPSTFESFGTEETNAPPTPPNVGGEMSSQNYNIVNSKLSIGGVELANSPNYQLSNTIGQIAPGKSASQNYNLHAGYRHMATTTSISISISNEPDVTLSPQVSGISGGTGNATTSWTVTTSNSAGYTLSVKASTDPALQTGNGSTSASFSDYTETTAGTPDYTWSITNTTSAFGFSVEGSDTASTFLDNGTTCNTGTGNTYDSCWSGFSTTAKTIAESGSATPNQGTVTTLNLRAEVGGNKIQQNGDYTATLTATALAT